MKAHVHKRQYWDCDSVIERVDGNRLKKEQTLEKLIAQQATPDKEILKELINRKGEYEEKKGFRSNKFTYKWLIFR